MGRLLTSALGATLLAIGCGGVIAPKLSSGQFGLATDDPVALAFVRATGARDVILGALVLAARDDAPSLRRILGFTSLIGLSDALAVASVRGLRPQHVLHLGGFAALALAALWVEE